MDGGRVAKGAKLSTAVVVACDEPTDAVGNSGRTGDFILRGSCQLGQTGEVVLIGRSPIQTGVGPVRVVPIQIVCDVGARGAHAVVGPQVHPLYQSNLLPILFLSSTIGMGYAAVTIEGAVSSMGLNRPFEKEILAKLLQVGRMLMVLYLVVRFGDLLWRGALGRAFEPSMPAMTFWIETFLFSAPLWLLATKEHRAKARRIFLAAMAMALGGIVYRLSAFLVAYQTGAGWHYFPSLGELTVTVGLIAFEVLAIIVAIRLLPILPAHQPGMRSTTP